MSLFFKFSGDRQAPGSFQQPVPVPVPAPDEGSQVCIQFGAAWLPYVLGCLLQLTMNTTWAVASDAELEAALQQANRLIYLFQNPVQCGCEQGSFAPEECEDDCMGCCLRFQNGVLQQYSCGQWVDVPGQAPGGVNQPGQPGAGSPVPAPGGCAQYNANMHGNSLWLLPVLVATGDTIQISDAIGATAETAFPWRCPDGFLYAEGACFEVAFTDPSAPMPSVQYGKLIAKIGSTFYDVYGPGPFTVPGGISNAQVLFQFNYENISGASGDVTFTATVCNNQTATWTCDQNLATQSGDWQLALNGSGYSGEWLLGSGWQTNDLTNAPNHSREIYLSKSGAVHLTRVQVYLDWTPGLDMSSGNIAFELRTNAVTLISLTRATMPGSGPGLLIDTGTISADMTQLFLDVIADLENTGTPLDGSALVTRIILSGSGPNPWC
jgi:hypothetical protein